MEQPKFTLPTTPFQENSQERPHLSYVSDWYFAFCQNEEARLERIAKKNGLSKQDIVDRIVGVELLNQPETSFGIRYHFRDTDTANLFREECQQTPTSS